MTTHIQVPDTYNYIGVFLTFACNLKCSYCINHHKQAQPRYVALTGAEWVQHLNRIQTRDDLPITIQGGEPTLHKDFYNIIEDVDKSINIDILTNLQFDINYFTSRLHPSRLARQSKYASIRVSYHLEQMELEDTISRVKLLQDRGFSVGVWIVDHPRDTRLVHTAQEIMLQEGIDCRLKEFLGEYNGKMYGTYRYPLDRDKPCLCKPTEMLIDPSGGIHACHHTLYTNKKAYASILSNDVKLRVDYSPCSYTRCEPCDIKIKNNRFQVWGHSSVEIKEAI